MLSPWCYGGCAERENGDAFHYWYHVKSGEVRVGDTPEDYMPHQRAAGWLRQHDLRGQDPSVAASEQYELPEGCSKMTVIPE